MDHYPIDSLRRNTSEPRPSLHELNKQWATHARQPQKVQTSEQRRRDDSARHAAIMDIAAYLVSIKHLLGLLLLCIFLNSLCTLFILWKRW